MVMFDMGVNISPNTTKSEVNMIIQKLDKIFSVVLIVEKLDESLILMKEKLCWEFSDIAYLLKNVRKDDWKSQINSDMRLKLRALNDADSRLYSYFLSRHETAVDRYGRDKMAKQVRLLNQHNDLLMQECSINMTETFLIKRPIGKDKSNYYKTNNSMSKNCRLSMSSELELIQMVRDHTNEMINAESYL